ncbi:energy-coupled thiamine transporter ThiT [Clostridium sp. LY3-2]|uniref:energy-coupled thiamine transporter ThiT n=1 Tax=Clostridium sp. LY3-2 TaxID=2942482 RepID=UPI002152A574|nr:energy-coupled thiamine transporter ThiT [Clostridium sp. LY3-2]MCR6514744.1 energy-coupled thiamine transporter ThiT [Clostridium sp. LY3-2]
MENFINSLSNNFIEIGKHPFAILAVIGCVLILIALFKIRKVNLDARLMTNIGIALALSTILNTFKIYHFPQGGGVTLGCMIPILIITFAYGPYVGFLTGFLYGIISLLTDPYIINPIQVLFDYPLPTICIGLAGYFKNKPYLGIGIAFFFKFLCHFISGAVFFGSYAPAGMSAVVYSLSVNFPLLLAECLITMVIFKLLPIKRLIKSVNPRYALN